MDKQYAILREWEKSEEELADLLCTAEREGSEQRLLCSSGAVHTVPGGGGGGGGGDAVSASLS